MLTTHKNTLLSSVSSYLCPSPKARHLKLKHSFVQYLLLPSFYFSLQMAYYQEKPSQQPMPPQSRYPNMEQSPMYVPQQQHQPMYSLQAIPTPQPVYVQKPSVYNQQPVPTKSMSIAPGGGNRNAGNMPVSQDGSREWTFGLCDCCSAVGTCFLAWCCPCIVYGQNKQRLLHLTSKGYPHPDHGGCCSCDCWLHACMTCCLGCSCVLQYTDRRSIRARYNIRGNCCGDMCSAMCCSPCELTQESQELQLEEDSFTHY